jgi:hypothetical protein
LEHFIELGHRIECNKITTLARSAGYTDRLVKEVIKILLHSISFNRDSRFILSQAFHPLISVLKQVKQHSDEWVQRDPQVKPHIMDADWRGGGAIIVEDGHSRVTDDWPIFLAKIDWVASA